MDVERSALLSSATKICPDVASRWPVRWFEVLPAGRSLSCATHDRPTVDGHTARSPDANISLDDQVTALHVVGRLASAPRVSLSCLVGLERVAIVHLRDALCHAAQLSPDWTVVIVATKPSPARDVPHRTVLPADTWAELFVAAGWAEIRRQPLAAHGWSRALFGAVPAHWLGSDPFRDGEARGEWLFLLRRCAAGSLNVDRSTLQTSISNVLRRRGIEPEPPLVSELQDELPPIACLIGSQQDYHQLLPLIEGLPASHRVVIVRQGATPATARARRDAIAARLEAHGCEPVCVTDPTQVPWDRFTAVLTASESTANSDHLMNAAFLIAARARGRHTFQLQHGIVPVADFSTPVICFAEHYLAWGRDVRHLVACTARERLQPGRLFHAVDRMRYSVTGCPKFDLFAQAPTLRPADLFGQWASRFQRTILVATNLHWGQHRDGSRVWPAIREMVVRRPNDLFILKLHPAEDPPDWNSSRVENLIVIDELSALDAGLDSARLVIASDALVCTLSTIALEAALAHRPFVVVKSGNPNRFNGVRTVDPDDLQLALAATLQRSRHRRTFVDAYVEPSTVGSARERVLGVMTRVVAGAGRRLPSGPAWSALEAMSHTLLGRDAHAGALEAAVSQKDFYLERLRARYESKRRA